MRIGIPTRWKNTKNMKKESDPDRFGPLTHIRLILIISIWINADQSEKAIKLRAYFQALNEGYESTIQKNEMLPITVLFMSTFISGLLEVSQKAFNNLGVSVEEIDLRNFIPNIMDSKNYVSLVYKKRHEKKL